MATIAESTTGQVDERLANKFLTVVTDTTTARAITASDIGAFIVSNNAAAVAFTIPAASSTAGKQFPIGSYFDIQTKGAGTVTVTVTTDTLTGTGTITTGNRKRVVKVAATEWAIA